MRNCAPDLNRYNSREIVRKPTIAPSATSAKRGDREFADRARALFAPLSVLRLPVVGIHTRDLSDSWHDPRDAACACTRASTFCAARNGDRRCLGRHLSYIGDQPKGGHCLWLTTEAGTSFYYAHLDRWAPGLYEGMEVQAATSSDSSATPATRKHTPSHSALRDQSERRDGQSLSSSRPRLPTQHAHLPRGFGRRVGTR